MIGSPPPFRPPRQRKSGGWSRMIGPIHTTTSPRPWNHPNVPERNRASQFARSNCDAYSNAQISSNTTRLSFIKAATTFDRYARRTTTKSTKFFKSSEWTSNRCTRFASSRRLTNGKRSLATGSVYVPLLTRPCVGGVEVGGVIL